MVRDGVGGDRMDTKELGDRSREVYHRVYDATLRQSLEQTAWGKYLIINVDTEEYFLADSAEDAIREFEVRFPESSSCMVRIGKPRLVA